MTYIHIKNKFVLLKRRKEYRRKDQYLPKMMESGRRISVETTHVLKIKT